MTLLLRRKAMAVSLGLFALMAATPGWSQFRVEVSGVGLTQMPLPLLLLKAKRKHRKKLARLSKRILSAAACLDQLTQQAQ